MRGIDDVKGLFKALGSEADGYVDGDGNRGGKPESQRWRLLSVVDGRTVERRPEIAPAPLGAATAMRPSAASDADTERDDVHASPAVAIVQSTPVPAAYGLGALYRRLEGREAAVVDPLKKLRFSLVRKP